MSITPEALQHFTLATRQYLPLAGFCDIELVENSDEQVIVKIPLSKQTQNHLGSMYFGALHIGADVAGGFGCYWHAQQLKKPLSFVFADVQAQFLRRADGDVYFECADIQPIQRAVEQACETGDRTFLPIKVTAKVNQEIVATFSLGLSMKLVK